MSGYCAIGKLPSENNPAKTAINESTVEKIGLSIKNDVTALFFILILLN